MLFRELLLAFPGLLGPITAPARSTDAEILRQISALADLLPEASSQPVETAQAPEPESHEGARPQSHRMTREASHVAQYDGTDTVDIPVAQVMQAVERDTGDLAPLRLMRTTLDQTNEIGDAPLRPVTEIRDDRIVGGQSSDPAVTPVKQEPPVVVDPPIVTEPGPVVEPPPTRPTPRPTPSEPGTPDPDTGTGPNIDPPVVTPENPKPTDPGTVNPDPGAMDPQSVSFQAEAGRVAILSPTAEGDIASIRILSQGEHGHVSVNPDNSLALVLSEDPGNTDQLEFSYEITYADGRTQEVLGKVDLTTGQQAAGWGQGDFYMLEEGQDGQVTVEHGDNHRKVYVTAGEHGLSRADIARAEGITADKITGAWLAEHPEYGATEDKALNPELGMAVWSSTASIMLPPTSNWLLLERGYDYGEIGRIISRGVSGESALHPLFIGAYGTGEAPIIDSKLEAYQTTSQHIVVQGLQFTNGIMALQGENFLLDNLQATKMGLNIQNINGLTLRNLTVIDVFRDHPADPVAGWQGMSDRVTGAYISGSTGVLLEGVLFDHNGWEDGYSRDLSGKSPQAPSMYSHNLYIQYDNLDVTVRDSILMRGASFGMQLRSGGVIEDVLALDNNAALATIGGNYERAGFIGNYSLFLDNLVTSAGHKRVVAHEGGLSIGMEGEGLQTSLIRNIIAHLSDPNNEFEVNQKDVIHHALKTNDSIFYNDTIVYNWGANGKPWANNPNRGVDGADTAVLDQTTIQIFTAKLLGQKTATIADLADYLRDQAAGKLDDVVDADLIIAFFQKGFGITADLRATEETLRFTPDARGDGMRWDNRLNWSTDDLPGTQDGDSVDLGGNRVLFGAQTVTVDDFIFGDHGQLKASSGRLDIEGEISTGTANKLQITNAGQVWIDGYRDSDKLTIDVDGGRLANTGDFAGRTVLGVSEQGQALLAVSKGSFDLGRDSSLTVTGSKARAGFDGADSGAAVLRLHNGSKVNLVADETGIGSITEFRSGAFGETSKVSSGVALDGTLTLNLKDYKVAEAGKLVLIDADQIIGKFDELSITGLGDKRDALVRIDYVRDEVTLVLGVDGKGTGQVRMNTNGEADFIDHTQETALKDLWQALHADAPQVSSDPL